jgi:hypothetical protein
VTRRLSTASWPEWAVAVVLVSACSGDRRYPPAAASHLLHATLLSPSCTSGARREITRFVPGRVPASGAAAVTASVIACSRPPVRGVSGTQWSVGRRGPVRRGWRDGWGDLPGGGKDCGQLPPGLRGFRSTMMLSRPGLPADQADRLLTGAPERHERGNMQLYPGTDAAAATGRDGAGAIIAYRRVRDRHEIT